MQRPDLARRPLSDLPAWLWVAAVLLVLLVGLAAAHHTTLRHVFDGAPPAVEWLRHEVIRRFHNSITSTFLHPLFLVMLALILLLEWRMPARPQQALLSVALAHDALYVPLFAVLRGVLFLGLFAALGLFYDAHLRLLTIESVRELPQAVRVVWGLVLFDFLMWLKHRLMHAVPWLWRFHAVHHAQRDLNLLTDARVHVFEFLVREAVAFLPMRMLSVDPPQIAALTLAITWQSRFYHSNVRTSLGPLRHIFVTPQSHRIHHSLEPGHQGRNFGEVLSVWDRLFGTQYAARADEYPATGITDPHFPHEQAARGLRFLLTPFAQLVYPLRPVAARLMPARALRAREG